MNRVFRQGREASRQSAAAAVRSSRRSVSETNALFYHSSASRHVLHDSSGFLASSQPSDWARCGEQLARPPASRSISHTPALGSKKSKESLPSAANQLLPPPSSTKEARDRATRLVRHLQLSAPAHAQAWGERSLRRIMNASAASQVILSGVARGVLRNKLHAVVLSDEGVRRLPQLLADLSWASHLPAPSRGEVNSDAQFTYTSTEDGNDAASSLKAMGAIELSGTSSEVLLVELPGPASATPPDAPGSSTP